MEERPNFTRWVRESVYEAQNGYCRCKDCLNKIDEFHHRMPNTVMNQKLYPFFLQSPFNCVGLCRACHGSAAMHQFKITIKEAQFYELYLQALWNQDKDSGLWVPEI